MAVLAVAPGPTEAAEADRAADWFKRFLAFPYTNDVPAGLPLQPESPQARPHIGARYPFSFTYGGESSDALLSAWSYASGSINSGGGVTTSWRRWTDPATGLCVRWESQTQRDLDHSAQGCRACEAALGDRRPIVLNPEWVECRGGV